MTHARELGPVALGFGFVLAALVCVAGPVSGAHFNPAVSLCAVLAGRQRPLECALYWVAQLSGALIGYGPVYVLVYPSAERTVAYTEDVLTALILEAIMTFLLALFCCVVWEEMALGRHDPAVPIKFGLLVAGLVFCGGPLSGAALNPARALAPAVWHLRFDHQWVYWIGPLLGASLAAPLHRYVLSLPQHPAPDVVSLKDKTAETC